MKLHTMRLLIGVLVAGWLPVARAAVFPEHPELPVFGVKFFEDFAAVRRPAEIPVGPEYILGPGDVLIINVWGFLEKEYQEEIGRDGSIVLPKLGKVFLGGRTFQDGVELLKEKLLSTYRNIQISVAVGKARTFPVFVVGEVRKPGSYEVSAGASIVELLSLAGGPTERGSLRRILLRKSLGAADAEVDLYPFLLEGKGLPLLPLSPGDTLFVPLAENIVGVGGAVRRPAVYEIRGPLTMEETIRLAGGFVAESDPTRIQVVRREGTGKIILDVKPDDRAGFPVQNNDVVTVFSLPADVHEQVFLQGAVRHPGGYGWRKGMRVADVLKEQDILPEGLKERAEIVRKKDSGGRTVLSFSPERLFAGDGSQNLFLLPQDTLSIYSKTRAAKTVSLQGDFIFPGEYVIESGERVSSVIRRAGGFGPDAYPPGIVFLRESVRIQKEKQLQTFIRAKEQALEREQERSDKEEEKALIERGRTLLKQLAETEVKGRIVLKADPDGSFSESRDILLEDGDIIYVPKKPVSIAIVGEVNQPTNLLFEDGQSLTGYVRKSGGFTKDANRREIFIVRTDGTADRDIRCIQTGDTIVVPFEARERMGKIVRDIIQVLYQISLSVAAFRP